MNKLILIILVLVSYMLSACGSESEEVVSLPVSNGDELLADESDNIDMATFPKTSEMESEAIQRSFENSPPLIPHTIDGMFKITPDQNQCMMCHMPEKAKEKNAKAIPLTHFTDYRPEVIQEGDKYVVNAEENEIVAISTGNELNKAMFNCNLCHAPQANIDPMVKNLFEADFRSSSSKESSNLNEVIEEGVN
jgi:cytochrome c-type protein NapB